MKPAGRDLVIAVDGPAASGKGTLAKRLAAHYGLPCLDTGLLYRIVARAMLDAGHDIHDAEAAEQIVGSFDEAGFPEERLRGREIGEAAAVVAAGAVVAVLSPQAAKNTVKDSKATTRKFHLDRCFNIRVLPLPKPGNTDFGR